MAINRSSCTYPTARVRARLAAAAPRVSGAWPPYSCSSDEEKTRGYESCAYQGDSEPHDSVLETVANPLNVDHIEEGHHNSYNTKDWGSPANLYWHIYNSVYNYVILHK